MTVDFTDIEGGESFELLCEDLLRAMGFTIEAKVARGPDLGKDIIATKTVTDAAGFAEIHRYLVECKHYARSGKSVQEASIGSPIARMGTHNCDRYILATSTVPSEKVRVQLDGVTNIVPRYKATAWHAGDLLRLLDEYPEVRERYFPAPEVEPPTPASSLAGTVEGLLVVMGFACQDREDGADRVRLVCTPTGAFARPMAVVCREGTVGQDDVEALLTEMDEKGLVGGVLVTHTRVSPASRERATRTDGAVRVFTLDEFYRELIDFEPYMRELVADYEDDDLSTYYVDLGCKSADGSEYKPMDEYVDAWLGDPTRNHISILGDYGTGKTSFCRQYAAKLGRRWLTDPDRNRIPILISLRDYAKAMNLEQLITDFLVNRYGIQAGYEAFRRFNEDGRLVLLFDGFDEMAARVDQQKMANNFWELAKTVVPNSKVILTCRTEHFHYAQQERRVLRGELQASTSAIKLETPKFEVLYLEMFDEDQVREVLRRRTDTATAKKIMDSPDLVDMTQRPVMIELVLEALPEVQEGKPADISHVYYYAVQRKMQRDIKAERTFTSLADKLYFLCELSWEMFSNDQWNLNYKLFPERIRLFFDQKVAEVDQDHWYYDLLGQTMLIRDEEGNYTLAHRSLLELFVAYKLAAEMGALLPEFTEAARQQTGLLADVPRQDYTWSAYFKGDRDEKGEARCIAPLDGFVHEPIEHLVNTVGAQRLTTAVLQLMAGMTNAEQLWRIIEATRDRDPEEVGYIGGNAATLLCIKGESLAGADLSHTILTGAVLHNTNLSGTTLEGTTLREADLSNCMLENANLKEADLQRADFYYAHLVGANLTSTLCQSTNFASANLRNTIFVDAKCSSYFNRASVEGANFKGAWLACSDWGGSPERVASHEEAKRKAQRRGAIV
jgi:KaiC/GvpD/RAD55 family RecA-like ATPase